MLTNIMATLPKKDGGSHIVAIVSTLYRLLMELDKEEVKEFEAANAYVNDSASTGSSATHAAEERALAAELAQLEGLFSFMILWDMKKFFDSIDIATLIGEAARVGFPKLQLILSLVVHHAPRRLKMGTAIGKPILQLGRPTLAGCKRSTDLARVYTLRLVKSLAEGHPCVQLYQHVDDISNLVTASTSFELVAAAVRYAMHFKQLTDELLLNISNKSAVVPATPEAETSHEY